MAKKRKQHDSSRATRELLIGAQFGWDCADPLEPQSEITGTWLSHSNPVKRILLKRNKKAFYGLSDKLKLKWKVEIEVEFRDPRGNTYYRGADLLIHGILREADGHYQEALEEIFEVANMRHYVTCHMKAEVIGNDVINDKDREAA